MKPIDVFTDTRWLWFPIGASIFGIIGGIGYSRQVNESAVGGLVAAIAFMLLVTSCYYLANPRRILRLKDDMVTVFRGPSFKGVGRMAFSFRIEDLLKVEFRSGIRLAMGIGVEQYLYLTLKCDVPPVNDAGLRIRMIKRDPDGSTIIRITSLFRRGMEDFLAELSRRGILTLQTELGEEILWDEKLL